MDKEHRNDSHLENPDPLSHFMFGKNMGSKEQKNSRNDGESFFNERKQQADDWFIGKRGHADDNKKKSGSASEEISIMDLLNGVDIEKLSGNIDTLMTTASQFKPLIKQVTPLLKKWIK